MKTNTIIWGDAVLEIQTLPENSVDAIITDPPYGIGFMGKEWDNFKPSFIQEAMEKDKRPKTQIASTRISNAAGTYDLSLNGNQKFQLWWEQVAKECLRVLKPGGFLLSFGGTRTYHRLVCGIEDAGFEIRDTIMWLYGSGFPKSLNIGKQMEKLQNADYEMVSKLIIKSGKPEKEIADYCGVSHALVRFWRLNERSIRRNEWIKLAELLDVKPKDYFIDAERDVLEKRWRTPSNKPEFSTKFGFGAKTDGHYDITTPTTPEAKEWEGWGTALKPACEPIVVARKPLSEKNVALNVLKHGTGGLNIDESRIEFEDTKDPATNPKYRLEKGYKQPPKGKAGGTTNFSSSKNKQNTQGRFPANIILDEEAGRMLDEQAPETGAFAPVKSGQKEWGGEIYHKFKTSGDDGKTFYGKGLQGASRFFYCAKASKSERNFGCETLDIPEYRWNNAGEFKQLKGQKGNRHPTVKPIKLIEYLIKLVSQEGAIVLDPFIGSGTTAIACLKLNRKFIGIEKESEYIKIAEARIKPFLEQTKL